MLSLAFESGKLQFVVDCTTGCQPVVAACTGWQPVLHIDKLKFVGHVGDSMRKIIHYSKTKLAVLLVFALTSAPGSLSLSAQQPAGDGAKLAKVEFPGLKRLAPETLLKVSGLEIGQAVNVDALDAAAQRLMDSGLVRKLSYRLQTKAGLAIVTFQVEEGRGGESAVIFDNFVWFTEEELANAVRREVPTFNGTAANSGNTADAITRALQRLVSERKITGTIDYLPSENMDHTKMEHVFSLKGVHLPICAVHFPGAQNIAEEKLIQRSQELVGTEYSRRFAGMFAFSNLFPIYREVGQLRAWFGQPQAKPVTTAECKEGVDLTIPIEEGAIYTWEKSVWSGNQTLTAKELDVALGMKSSEIANGLKLDKGLEAVRKAYGRKGYLEAFVRPQPDFDDAARRVTYRLDVKEGPQYRMGNLIIKGFSENLGNYLRGKWEMKRDDVYDAGYADEFFVKDFNDVLRKVAEEGQEQGLVKPKKAGKAVNANRATLTVDVTFELSD